MFPGIKKFYQTKKTRKELKALAEIDLRKKISLENTFKREISRLFNRMLDDNKKNIIISGVPISAERFRPAWGALLDNHYARVQKAFSNTVAAQNKKSFKAVPEPTQEEEDSMEELFLLALLRWREDSSETQAQTITNTNGKNLINGVNTARAESEEPLSNRELATAATAVTRRSFQNRIDTIATTETQGAAESTKFFDADITARVLTALKSFKTWVTMGDSIVRAAHAAANFQRVSITDVFIVKGERLRFPRDTALGASVGNVANCRCSAVYSIA